MKVLIVDDDAMNRKVLRAVLVADGHTVLEDNDGLDALQIAALDSTITEAKPRPKL